MRKVLLCIFIAVLSAGLYSIEITKGNLRLNLNEDNGRFSLVDLSGEAPMPLLYPEDTRTSKFSVNIDNTVYVPGDSFEFRSEVTEISNGLRIIWTSRSLEITQDLMFISSPSSNAADGLHVKIQLKNVSEYSSVVSARYLLDTYLGESSQTHFYLSTGRRITSETELVNNIPDFIVSPVEDNIESGLQIMTSAPGITTPARVILANWKRLNDSNWQYTANTQRTFSSPPYSINDSACALYYAPRTLSRGQVYEINIAFGAYTHTGFSPDYSIRDREISSIVEKTEQTGGENRIESIRQELTSVEDFLNQVDVMLESGEAITNEKLYLLEQIIRNLEDKKSQY